MKKILVTIVTVLLPTLALADELPPGGSAAAFNCDYQPSCEVAPGVYGKMSSPAQSKFDLSIGGFVRLDYAYNSENFGAGGFQSPDGTVPSRGITSQNGPANQSQSILTARTSRLWFKVGGPTFLGAKTGAYVEADFVGDASAATESPMVRMRQAKGTLDWDKVQVLFGEDWDIFGPMVAGSIDFRNGTAYGTPNSQRVPQLRVTTRTDLNENNAIKVVLGAQDPTQIGNNSTAGSSDQTTAAPGGYGAAVNVAGQISLVSKSLGTAPAIYGLGLKPLTATFFGLYGSEKAPSNDNHHLDSYGYGFYAFVPLLSSKDGKCRAGSISFEGQTYAAYNMAFNHATALAAVGTPASGATSTFAPTSDLSPARGYGYAAEIIGYPTQDLGITVGYGSRRARDYDSYTGMASYQKWTSSFYANASYDLNAAVRVAAEYQNLQSKYGNANGTPSVDALGNDNTIRFAAYYFF